MKKTTMEELNQVLIPFYPDSNIILSGSTMTGKTSFVYKFLCQLKFLYKVPPSKILYCYSSTYQPIFDQMKQDIPEISFCEGMPNSEHIDTLTHSGQSSILVLDDMMSSIINSEESMKWFTQGTHHLKMSIIFIMQNIFLPGKYAKTIAVNSQYIFLFSNLRDHSQINRLGMQIFPEYKNFLLSAYKSATETPYSYLLIDLHPLSPNKYRIRTDIFNKNTNVVYLPP